MRRPPSPALLPMYPVAGGLGLMATAVTVMTLTNQWRLDAFVMRPSAFHGEPWRLVTSALPHGDPLHLIFNVYWLWVFGTLLEEQLGHIRLLALILLFEAGSGAAEYALFQGGIGLSGAGYGLFALLWVLSSRDKRFAGAVDKRTAQLFGVWFVFCIVATQMKAMAIANVAHGVGALLGGLTGLAMSARGGAQRVLSGLAVPAVVGASFVGATVLRPRVNLAHDGSDSFQVGYQAIQEQHYDEAIKSYRDSIALQPNDEKAWFNLGIAYQSQRELDDAVAAYRRAYEIDASPRHRQAYIGASLEVAREAMTGMDFDRAEHALLPVADLDPADTRAWATLVGIYDHAGRKEDSEHAIEAMAKNRAKAH